ncbi:hypothetical protein SASPL_135552 [Salvia splendens]|uniref:glutathione transferase n=1 Tax=Salvia splendens TaxID=180675 RepID=A0A8X8WWQ5_SALSN|nr:hypothetical protein SASPL_135552 [Salvia splendens]
MVVKVYGATYAACPQRVMACLFELGFQFDLIKVDLQSGEQKQPQNLLRQGQVGDMELVRDCKGKLEKVLDVYEERLSKSKYLGGERFTIADLTHLPNTRFLMEEGGMEDLIKRRKNLHNWWLDISSRPSWLKVMDLPK